MDKELKPAVRGRRAFLKTVGVGAAAAGIAGIAVSEAPRARAQSSTNTGGYRETEHVKRVYELARKF